MRLSFPHTEDTHVHRQWLHGQYLTGLPGGSPACYGDTSEQGVNSPAWKIREGVSTGQDWEMPSVNAMLGGDVIHDCFPELTAAEGTEGHSSESPPTV